MKKLINKKKFLLLAVVLGLYTIIVTPLLVINLQKQQDLRGRADTVTWSTTQSAQTQCSPTGTVQIAYSFSNTEATRAMNVTANDSNTGNAVTIGQVNAGQTMTGVIDSRKNTLTNGSLTFSLAWTTSPTQTDQRIASYTALTCQSPTPTPAGSVCPVPTSEGTPSDDVLIIDKSGSMNDKVGSNGTKISNARSSASNFVDIVSNNKQNNIGLVSFATTATLDSPLSSNYSNVKTQINALGAGGNTCIQCAIDQANKEMTAHGRQSSKKVVVLLTDGLANTIEGNSKQVDQVTAEQKALDAANAGHSANGTIFYTIGLGNDVNADFLKQLANATGGQYYFSPTTDQLTTIYAQVAQEIAKGSISGFVFKDSNNNGIYDSSEQKLKGWPLQLTLSGSTQVKTITTDATGSFIFDSLCSGNYTLKEVQVSGWTQTLPVSGGNYTINLGSGDTVTGKNFGNYPIPTPTATPKPRCSDGIDNDNNGLIDSKDSTCHTDGNPNNPNTYNPNKDGEHGGNTCDDGKDNNGNGLTDGADPICHTDGNPNNPNTYDPNRPELSPTATITSKPTPTSLPTPTPTGPWTSISITVFQHGIGNSGDNSNPNQFSLSNKNPLHASIPADILVYNVNNQLVASGAGVIKYHPDTGNYQSDLICSGGNSFQTGKYNVKVKTAYHLRRLLPGIQTITVGQNNPMPSITLVAGDVNNDNLLNIKDYNMLLDCYSDLAAAPACSDPNKKVATDLNDDGKVNQVDYNLFLREISTQPGE